MRHTANTVDLGQLIGAASGGDEAAWCTLVDRFKGLVWSVVRAYRVPQLDAADVVQTTWLRLVENLDRIHDPERLGAWLATVVRRECLRVIREGSRELPTSTAEVFDRGRSDSVIEQVLIDERDRAVHRGFERLDERCRRLLSLLAAADPPSYQEVSAALDMPIGAIGPTRSRCLAKLRATPEIEGLALC